MIMATLKNGENPVTKPLGKDSSLGLPFATTLSSTCRHILIFAAVHTFEVSRQRTGSRLEARRLATAKPASSAFSGRSASKVLFLLDRLDRLGHPVARKARSSDGGSAASITIGHRW